MSKVAEHLKTIIDEQSEVIAAQKERTRSLRQDLEAVYQIVKDIDVQKVRAWSPILADKIERIAETVIPF